MTILPAQVNELSLHDLRNQFRGSLPQRNADRMSNLGSKVPLELADSVADFAFLGQKIDSVNAKNFRRQLCKLSGTAKDENIIGFESELVEIEVPVLKETRQVIFLKPLKASMKEDDQFVAQSPVIIYEHGDEIHVIRPSLTRPGGYLTTSIRKRLSTTKDSEKRLVEFINWTDEENITVGTGISFVSEKSFDMEVCKEVADKMKAS